VKKLDPRSFSLRFSFPEVHPEAHLDVAFERTFRVPDDGQTWPLPPRLGRFPIKHVDDFPKTVPADWLRHRGVMLPMYQSEAMMIHFSPHTVSRVGIEYPFAIKIAAGKVNALTGQRWSSGLDRNPQGYVVAPPQTWLDGFSVEKGVTRQFIAMPLGSGHSAEEQVLGKAEYGGLQIEVFPIKKESFESANRRIDLGSRDTALEGTYARAPIPDQGLGPGGWIREEIYKDRFRLEEWDLEHSERCWVHLCNSLMWKVLTDTEPPPTPATPEAYAEAGLPWSDYFGEELSLVEGSEILARLKSILQRSRESEN
jgi:hypothetical protein